MPISCTLLLLSARCLEGDHWPVVATRRLDMIRPGMLREPAWRPVRSPESIDHDTGWSVKDPIVTMLQADALWRGAIE